MTFSCQRSLPNQKHKIIYRSYLKSIWQK